MHGAVAQFEQAVHVEVFAAGEFGQLPMFERHFQARAQRAQRRQARRFVADVFRQHVLGRQRLAEVVGQRGETDHGIARRQSRRHVADQFDVHAGIDFRVVFGALRHAVQGVDFRQHHRKRAAVVQRAQECRRRGRGERARQFLPDAFGRQFGQFAIGDHRPHQLPSSPARR